jgi:probable rRNA maturation factor
VPALALTVQGSFDGMPARSTLARWIRAALARDAELTLRFVDAGESRRLNRDFRGKDYPTDVLTFSYSTQPTVRADIVISVPVLRRAARVLRKPLYDHLAHLIVHGVLHAHGRRHESEGDARAMRAREALILRALGKAAPYG